MADSRSLLYNAIINGNNLDTIKKLVENGASVNEAYYARPLDAAVEVNNAEIVNYLLEYVDYDINDTYDGRGKTLLHEACDADCSDISIIENLLHHGMKVNNEDYYGATALHYACKMQKKNVVALLIEYGADINYCDETSDYGCSPIFMALSEHSTDIVELLLQHGAQVLTISSRDYSLLANALKLPVPDTAKLLLKHVANLSSPVELDWTTLSCAVYDCNVDLTKQLLEKGHEIDMLTLYSASICGNYSLLEIIWNKIPVDTVSNDLYFMIHIFDNWKLQDGFEKLMLLLSKEGVDLHLNRSGRAFAFYVDRSGIAGFENVNKDQLFQLMHRLVSRGLYLNPPDVTRIIHKTCYSCGKQIFETIIDAALPKISGENFSCGLEMGLGKYLMQYCLEVHPDLILCSEDVSSDLDFLLYSLSIFTFADEYKDHIISLLKEHSKVQTQEDVCRILKMMEMKSLVELSRDAVRSHLKNVCIDTRHFLNILDHLQLPARIKDIIQCKTPVNKYACNYRT